MPRRSLLAAAYEPSASDGLPNAISAIVQIIPELGTPSATGAYYWSVFTWVIKFGATQLGAPVSRFVAAVPPETFTRERLNIELPSGRILSVPAALAAINPPDMPDPARRAAHAIMYTVPGYDLFDLCFRDTAFVAEAILDFDAFFEWLDAQPSKPKLLDLLTRYITVLAERAPAGIDAALAKASFVAWLERRAEWIGRAEAEAAIEAVSTVRPRRPAADVPSPVDADIDVYGYFADPIGIGEDARFAATALELAGYRVNRLALDDANNLPPATAPVALWAVPAPNLATRALRFTEAHERQITILAAPWELPQTPPGLAWVYRGVDAICVYSSFVEDSLPADVRKATTKVPMAFDIAGLEEIAAEASRAETFTFAAMFDFGSTVRRKGPHHAIAAFKTAFPHGENVRLIIKSTNAGRRPADWQRLQVLADGDPRISFIDAKWDTPTLRRWLARAHVFVSLHASEGFGRVLAESMLLDTLVIATHYSGSREVCTPNTALLVPHTLVELGPNDYPFGAGQYWALPDIAAAAAAMRDAAANWRSPRLAALRQQGRDLVRSRFTIGGLSAALRSVVEKAREQAAVSRALP